MPEHELDSPSTQSPLTLIILVGLPASGKSTFYRERFAGTHVLVSKDLIPRSTDKRRRQRYQIETALTEGRSVVVDNTNVSRAERAEAIEIARTHGASVVAYRFVEGVAACRERNARREGAACVPLVALYAAAKRLEEPTSDEGIDGIHRVRMVSEGFTIVE